MNPMNDSQKRTHRRETTRTRNILTRALVYAVLALSFLSAGGLMWPIRSPALVVSAVVAPVKRDEVSVTSTAPAHKRRCVTRRRRTVARKLVTCAPCCALAAAQK